MRKIILVAAGAGMVVATPAVAGTNSATLTVTAEVVESCEVSDATLAWTGLGVLNGADHDTSTSMSLTCTDGSDYNVTMGAGGNAVAGQRYMAGSGTDTIPYDLYLGVPTSGTILAVNNAVAAGTGNGAAQPLTIGGRIPASAANVAADSYSDSVAVTITF